jgi:phosphoribosylformylglycinamidine cyclo-ligase
MPVVFNWLQTNGNIEATEMYRTFNCGIGMTVVVAAEHASKAVELLNAMGENAMIIGKIVDDASEEVVLENV